MQSFVSGNLLFNFGSGGHTGEGDAPSVFAARNVDGMLAVLRQVEGRRAVGSGGER